MTSDSENESVFYTACMMNCGAGYACVLKGHLRDGRVVRIEADDRYNPGVGREDAVLSEEDLLKGKLQSRPCAKGFVFHNYCDSPDRVVYPLKRSPGSRRGEGKFVRISWDEALTTIAGRMKVAREEYGPYSVMAARNAGPRLMRLFQLWGAGIDSWGGSSYDAASMMAHIVAGDNAQYLPETGTGSAAELLTHSKLIVLWGLDPAVTVMAGPSHQLAYWIKLCRERGKQVIIIDPRYTASAEALADQWIPIKPGTDLAMFAAMCYVLLKEDLWDKEFVTKHVEPVGFEKWKDYLLGREDGVEKSPEWAESRCSVPAETILALTRLAATARPAWLWCAYAVNKKSHGEQTMRAFAALQAMLGYWGAPGGGPIFLCRRHHLLSPFGVSLGPGGDYRVPKSYRSHQWAQGILLLEEVRSGELSEKDYIRMVGWKGSPAVLRGFNPRVFLWSVGSSGPYERNYLVTTTDSANDEVRAMEKMDFIAAMGTMITPAAKYADIFLPTIQRPFEDRAIAVCDRGAWTTIAFMPGPVKAPGEARSELWIHVKLAEKLGIDPRKYFRYYTSDESWDIDYERYLKDCYQQIAADFKKRDFDVPPWEEFVGGKFINCDEMEYGLPRATYGDEISQGKAFKTGSGKVEVHSAYIADGSNRGKSQHLDPLERPYNFLQNDWGDMPPMPAYRPGVRGMDDALAGEYPLMLLTTHSRYRVNSWLWETPWLRDHVYQHRVWINAADASSRGIEDGDLVRVYNDRGAVVMPAYVTSRILPGVTVIHHGGQYAPDESGVDRGATGATLLGGDFESCVTPIKASNLVQITRAPTAHHEG
ncbi:MAG: molybdopterin-dependent oxidoreductase [Chloroflexi bacterium]|nr:molybdopterin-dependent oxidoreductase [Chloroflexota bacterium]